MAEKPPGVDATTWSRLETAGERLREATLQLNRELQRVEGALQVMHPTRAAAVELGERWTLLWSRVGKPLPRLHLIDCRTGEVQPLANGSREARVLAAKALLDLVDMLTYEEE